MEVIAGNVVTREQAAALIEAGADALRVWQFDGTAINWCWNYQLILEEENEKTELNDDDDNEEHSVISIQEDFSLRTWLQCFEEQESEEFDMKEIKIFRKYVGIMQRKLFESKTQRNITSFFMPGNM